MYAELVHVSVDLKSVLHFFLENFITDRFGILYSHSSLEKQGLSSLSLKFYFYDGFTENKLLLLSKNLSKSFKFTKRLNKRKWVFFRSNKKN